MKFLLLLSIVFCSIVSQEAYDIVHAMEQKEKPINIKSLLKMETTKANTGKKRVSIFKSWVKNNGEKQLIWFLEPKEYKGISFLKLEKNDFTDMRMWHPRYKKIRKIISNNSSDSFMNSELTFEDLYIRKIDDYNYSLKQKEKFNQKDCYLIVSHIKNLEGSFYLKHETWIATEHLIPLKEISYNLKGAPIKHKIFNYDEKQSLKSLKIINLENQNYTDLYITELDTLSEIKDSYFKENSLKRIPQ